MKLAWIHWLRILAAAGVVLIHTSADAMLNIPDTSSLLWEVGNFCNACCRWTVPAFVMISGYLLLEPGNESAVQFFRRRLKRLLVPTVVAVALFSVFTVAESLFSPRASMPATFHFDSAQIVPLAIQAFKNAVTGFAYYHLWYLYMILGLFLLTPLFRKIIARLTPKMLGGVCALLFAAMVAVVSYLTFIKNMECVYIIKSSFFFTWFLPYVGYYFCGYFLRIKHVRFNRWLLISIFVLSIAATTALGRYFASNYSLQLGLYFHSFMGITALPATLSIFILLQHFSLKENQFIETAGNLTFGIYLVHPVFLSIVKIIGMDPTLNHSEIGIPILAIGVFAISGAVVYIFQHLSRKPEQTMEERMSMPADERTSLF